MWSTKATRVTAVREAAAREEAVVKRSAASAAGAAHTFKTRPAAPQAEFLAGAAEASGREGKPWAAAINARGGEAAAARKWAVTRRAAATTMAAREARGAGGKGPL